MLNKKKFGLLLFPFVFLSCSSLKNNDSQEKVKLIHADQHANLINLDNQDFTLDNGLKVILNKKSSTPVFSIYIYYGVGGKNETQGLYGASHYLEHMMFKGAKKFKQGEFEKIVEGNGGTSNAYTTQDLTVYFEKLPIEYLELILDLEADRMDNLTMELDSFEKEKAVVLEEKRMRYENSDRGKIFKRMNEEVFKGTPYEVAVIGKSDNIKNYKREDIYKYFKKFYVPNNAVIVISGDIEFDKTKKLVEKYFGNIKSGELDGKVIEKGFDFKLVPFENKNINIKGTSPTPLFNLTYKGVKLGERKAFVLDILSSILTGGESSYLNQKLVKGQNASLSNIYAANYNLMHSGVFFISGQLLSATKLSKIEKELKNRLKESCDEAISKRNVQKVKNNYLYSFYMNFDSTDSIAQFLGDREVYFGDYKFYNKELDIYNSITASEVMSACKELFEQTDTTFITLWSKNK